jgi:hypothetical protein
MAAQGLFLHSVELQWHLFAEALAKENARLGKRRNMISTPSVKAKARRSFSEGGHKSYGPRWQHRLYAFVCGVLRFRTSRVFRRN